jgi:hypothetical protein
MFGGSSQMCELFRPFRDILPVFMFWFCSPLWSRDMTMHGVFSAFTFRPVCLLVASKTYKENPNSSTSRSEAVQYQVSWKSVEWFWSCYIQRRERTFQFLENVKPKRSLEATILRLKLRYFGHVMRAKKVTGTGHYAWTSCRTQAAGKTTDAMAWQHQGSYRTTIGRHERSSTRQEKIAYAGGRKDSE